MQCLLVGNFNGDCRGEDDGPRKSDVGSSALGLLAIAATAEVEGHSVQVLDLDLMVAEEELRPGPDFAASAARMIAGHPVELFGFSTMASSFPVTLEVARQLKKLRPKARILLGGPQVSFCAKEVLERFEWIEYVLAGEADITFPRFLACLEGDGRIEDVPGLSWRRPDGTAISAGLPPPVDDLDALPLPAWHLVPGGTNRVEVGRGCPFSCTFCSTSAYFQRRFRMKSPARVMSELSALKSAYGYEAFTLVHDNFTVNRRWVEGFCHEVLNSGQAFTWSASSRIDTVSAETIELMARAGCSALFFGVESGSERMQKAIGKRCKLDRLLPTAKAAIDAGITPTFSFIFGFPDETEDDIRATFAAIAQLVTLLDANVQLHLLSPQLGTADFRKHRKLLSRDLYNSDIAGLPRPAVADLVSEHPDIFAPHFHYAHPTLPRWLLTGADRFVGLMANNMRMTMSLLIEQGLSPWEFYSDWRHSDPVGTMAKIEGPADEFAMAVLDFAMSRIGSEELRETGRDEIIAFYLRRFHGVDVRCSA